eukprot:TRINITY_DN110239_c0_g1_i1.p1 TRINITY_DN110239_c0_g1~~TRINITY_DN110239_c0_g1_i1.p1  ORF type:complete len:520 (+),score=90.11 TRINITY_DN110239_c0_g1_i1:59-1618(+)
MDAINQHGVFQTVKAAVLPLSALALCAYPLILFISTFVVGSGRSQARQRAPFAARVQTSQPRSEKLDASAPLSGACMFVAAVLAAAPLMLVFPGSLLGFATPPAHGHDSPGASLAGQKVAGFTDGSQDPAAVYAGPTSALPSLATSVGCVVGFGSLCLALRLAGAQDKKSGRQVRKDKLARKSSGVLRRCASSKEVLNLNCDKVWRQDQNVFRYSPPADAKASLWHHVDLVVRDWLDEETGTFRYINEMPRGSLQKFELQTKMERNVIREDAKGSRKLQAFGKPVVFNYGCFPQTYRDPCELDETYNAPGDDDPLDVLEIGQQTIGVGEVVKCRPLGAVCLIDEGQADWKVIVVNTEADGPLASARSIGEVEAICPGRIEQALRWIDDFKQHSSKSGTTLHYEIHDAERAVALIRKDHSAWKHLCTEAQATGRARDHWVSDPKEASSQPAILNVGLPSMPRPSGSMANLAGATKPGLVTTRRAHTLRRHSSPSGETSSEGEYSSSTDRSPLSSDAELGF